MPHHPLSSPWFSHINHQLIHPAPIDWLAVTAILPLNTRQWLSSPPLIDQSPDILSWLSRDLSGVGKRDSATNRERLERDRCRPAFPQEIWAEILHVERGSWKSSSSEEFTEPNQRGTEEQMVKHIANEWMASESVLRRTMRKHRCQWEWMIYRIGEMHFTAINQSIRGIYSHWLMISSNDGIASILDKAPSSLSSHQIASYQWQSTRIWWGRSPCHGQYLTLAQHNEDESTINTSRWVGQDDSSFLVFHPFFPYSRPLNTCATPGTTHLWLHRMNKISGTVNAIIHKNENATIVKKTLLKNTYKKLCTSQVHLPSILSFATAQWLPCFLFRRSSTFFSHFHPIFLLEKSHNKNWQISKCKQFGNLLHFFERYQKMSITLSGYSL